MAHIAMVHPVKAQMTCTHYLVLTCTRTNVELKFYIKYEAISISKTQASIQQDKHLLSGSCYGNTSNSWLYQIQILSAQRKGITIQAKHNSCPYWIQIFSAQRKGITILAKHHILKDTLGIPKEQKPDKVLINTTKKM